MLEGLGCSLQACAPSSVTDGLNDFAEQMSEGMAAPAFLRSSRTMILSKGELQEEQTAVHAIAGCIGPIAHMLTDAKLTTFQIFCELWVALATAVDGVQSVSMMGQCVPGNSLGVDGARAAYNLRADIGAAGLPLDFAASFPDLGRSAANEGQDACSV